MVPKAGLEPARLTPLPPQDSVSTNSTTWAKTFQQNFKEPIGEEIYRSTANLKDKTYSAAGSAGKTKPSEDSSSTGKSETSKPPG